MVFILERMGETKWALSLLIQNIRSVRQAIAFVEEHKDEQVCVAVYLCWRVFTVATAQLWEELIARSLENADFLSEVSLLCKLRDRRFVADFPVLVQLLEYVGSHSVDLLKLMTRIPADLAIPHLQSKLIHIIGD